MFWKKKDEPKANEASKAVEPVAGSAAPPAGIPVPAARNAMMPAAAPAAAPSPAPAAAKPQAVPASGEPAVTALASSLAPQLGKAVGIMMGSPRHQGLTLREIASMLLPALINDQFVIAEAKPKGQNITAPVGLIVWARVSDEIDRRLLSDTASPTTLRPEDWRSGNHPWVIEMVGNQQVVDAMVQQLKDGPLKGQQVKFRVRGDDGRYQAYAA